MGQMVLIINLLMHLQGGIWAAVIHHLDTI